MPPNSLGEKVTAVVVPVPLVRYLEDDFTEERPIRIRVLHNPFANVSLPREVFSDEVDTVVRRVGDRWELKPGRWPVELSRGNGRIEKVVEDDTWTGSRYLESDKHPGQELDK